MEGDQEPFPKMLFVNEAFLHTNASESSVTEEEIERKNVQSDDFRLQTSTHGVKTEGWKVGNSWCGHSNDDVVEFQSENNEIDKLRNDSHQIKCESEITQVDTDSLVFNDAENIEVKVESIEEECFFTGNSSQMKCESEITQVDTGSLVFNDAENIEVKVESIGEECFLTADSEIKVEIDMCDDSESKVLEYGKEHNQVSSNDCNEIKLKREEEGNVSFNSPGRTTNADGNQVIYDGMSTEFYSIEQEKLKDCSVSLGPRVDEVKKGQHIGTWNTRSNNEISSTFSLNHGKMTDPERKDELNHQIKIESGDEPEKFPECHDVIIENVGLLNPNTKSRCIDSVTVFNNNGQMGTYARKHKGKKKYKCTICDKTFTQRSHLNDHMRRHTGEKPFKCTICDITFTKNSSLTTHMRRHTGEKPYECTLCHETFSITSDLNEHMRYHTGEKPYKCTICDKTFISNTGFVSHMRYHTGENLHKCTICDKPFTQPSHLNEHMRRHTGEKPFKCTICDKTFISKSQLTSHMRCHTEEKPFKCSICDMTFSRKSSLITHIRRHTGEKPYKCTICDKTFSRTTYLNEHMRYHTGEKPYKCTICEKTFISNFKLTTHMRRHTGEKPYKCTICDKTFISNSGFASHMRGHTEKTDELNHQIKIESGDEPEKFPECHDVIIENVGLLNPNTNSRCIDSVTVFNHNGQMYCL